MKCISGNVRFNYEVISTNKGFAAIITELKDFVSKHYCIQLWGLIIAIKGCDSFGTMIYNVIPYHNKNAGM